VVNRGVYPDLVDIQYRILAGIDAETLNYPMIVIEPVFGRVKLDQGWILWLVDKEIANIREYPFAYGWGSLGTYLI
jgi:hypothetical protein